MKKIIKFFLKKMLRVMKSVVLLHPQSTENGGCKFFESNEPIKSSLKGKEPFNSRDDKTGESARQTEKDKKVEQYTMKSLILAQDER